MKPQEQLHGVTLLNTRQVRDALKISNTTLYRWIGEGIFPKPYRLGDSRINRWTVADIERFIRESQQAS